MSSFVMFTDPETGRESLIDSTGHLLINVHHHTQCAGEVCVIHSPTDHHMKDWPMRWDWGPRMFLRTCVHKYEHPDPDQFEFLAAQNRSSEHACDGCCVSE